MPAGTSISLSDFYYILPELVLIAGSLILLVADVLLPRGSRALPAVAVIALLATMASLVPFAGVRVEVAHGLIAVDGFGGAVGAIALAVTVTGADADDDYLLAVN